MKYCVIGVGRFGYHVATTLFKNGAEVLAIDSNSSIIESIKEKVTQAICMRITDEEDLRAIMISDFDVVIVAMGENFAQSILVTALLKQNLKIPQVITRSINKIHKDILNLIGADQVILPEQEMGIKLADTLSLPGASFIRVTHQYSLVQLNISKKYHGKQIATIEKTYGIRCIGIIEDEIIQPIENTQIINEHELLLFLGKTQDLAKLN